ncbi:hypothetical protein PIB30_098903 [Stylosanthes scabra]|uniref:Uncharacterized protein n=1 Tax=Stylosanthes scabra TaxID=79078 RepID=A0ABU6YWA0_9FABA|nr:hypothetical protein [Stylosanthes scabra]
MEVPKEPLKKAQPPNLTTNGPPLTMFGLGNCKESVPGSSRSQGSTRRDGDNKIMECLKEEGNANAKTVKSQNDQLDSFKSKLIS